MGELHQLMARLAAFGSPEVRVERNGTNIAGATSATSTLSSPAATDNGAMFHVVVTNSSGSVTSAAAAFRVITSEPPVATTLQPAAGALYTAADTFDLFRLGE